MAGSGLGRLVYRLRGRTLVRPARHVGEYGPLALHQAATATAIGTGGGLGTVMELTRRLGGTAAAHGDADGKSIRITHPF